MAEDEDRQPRDEAPTRRTFLKVSLTSLGGAAFVGLSLLPLTTNQRQRAASAMCAWPVTLAMRAMVATLARRASPATYARPATPPARRATRARPASHATCAMAARCATSPAKRVTLAKCARAASLAKCARRVREESDLIWHARPLTDAYRTVGSRKLRATMTRCDRSAKR